MKKYLAELTGTFALVFCGTGAIIVNEQTGGLVGNLGIAFSFGGIIMAMIYTFGDTSGAHFNPAVTLAFGMTPFFDKKKIAPYLLFQLTGACIASLLLKFLFPTNNHLGATLPSGSLLQSFVLEVILTFILVLVILSTSMNKHTKAFAGIAIGAVVLLEAAFAGPISGASMNPARSIAPVIVSGKNTDVLWLYLTAPLTGGILAVLFYKLLSRG